MSHDSSPRLQSWVHLNRSRRTGSKYGFRGISYRTSSAETSLLDHADCAFSRGLVRSLGIPGLTSWNILSRPFGTHFVSGVLTQTLKADIFSIGFGTTQIVRCYKDPFSCRLEIPISI
jgi:hypothetical protein